MDILPYRAAGSEPGGPASSASEPPVMQRSRKGTTFVQLGGGKSLDVTSPCMRIPHWVLMDEMCVYIHTSFKNLLDLDVVGTEAAVELEVVGVVEEGGAQGEQQPLVNKGRVER